MGPFRIKCRLYDPDIVLHAYSRNLLKTISAQMMALKVRFV